MALLGQRPDVDTPRRRSHTRVRVRFGSIHTSASTLTQHKRFMPGCTERFDTILLYALWYFKCATAPRVLLYVLQLTIIIEVWNDYMLVWSHRRARSKFERGIVATSRLREHLRP